MPHAFLGAFARLAMVLAAFVCAGALAQPRPPAAPATYHVAPGGSDRASGQAGAPWATWAHAWLKVRPGDTVVVADGKYEQASPPAELAGEAGRPITFRASRPGGAQLEGLLFKGNAHLVIEGFRIDGKAGAVGVMSAGRDKPSHHLAFRQIGFSCTPGTLNDGACFGMGDGTHHVVLEDSWGWGGGRYTILCYGGPGGKPANLGCDHNTFRRVVLRMGPARSSSGNPQASLALYYASHNVVENVVALDGAAASNSSNAAFYVTGHAPPPRADGNRFLGVVALGNRGGGLYVDCPGAICDRVEVRDSVFWGATEFAVAIASGRKGGDSCVGAVIDRNTLGATIRGVGYANYACEGATLTNSAIVQNEAFGARQSPSAGSTPTAHHNGYFGNLAGARSGVRAGTGDLSSNPGIRHLLRVDPASPYRKAGEGGDIGATVTRRYHDGRLTAEDLWPWPHEERLREELCAVPEGAFCRSGKRLTRYLWEYLGTPIPAEFDR